MQLPSKLFWRPFPSVMHSYNPSPPIQYSYFIPIFQASWIVSCYACYSISLFVHLQHLCPLLTSCLQTQAWCIFHYRCSSSSRTIMQLVKMSVPLNRVVLLKQCAVNSTFKLLAKNTSDCYFTVAVVDLKCFFFHRDF